MLILAPTDFSLIKLGIQDSGQDRLPCKAQATVEVGSIEDPVLIVSKKTAKIEVEQRALRRNLDRP